MESQNSQSLIDAAIGVLDILLTDGSNQDTLQHAFQALAETIDLDRINLVEYHEDTQNGQISGELRLEWRRADAELVFDNPDNADINMDSGTMYLSRPGRDSDVRVTQRQTSDSALREQLEAHGIHTAVSTPVELHGRFSGSLNLIHTRHPAIWSDEQLAVMRTIAHALVSAYLRKADDSGQFGSSDELSREAFDNATVGMAVLASDGTMLQANDALCALLGYEREQLIGRNTLMLAHPDDVAHIPAMRDGIRSLEITDAERRFVRSDGETVWTQCNISPLQHDQTQTAADAPTFVAQIRDITAIRQAGVIAELERANQELEQFAYIASHDLQEPLRMITSYLELLQRRYSDQLDDDAQEFISFAVDGATRMRALISSLLAYSRLGIDAYKPVSTDLTATLEQAMRPLRLLIEENNARITYENLPVVQGDETQLTQLFQNLIENAIKFHSAAPPEIHVSSRLSTHSWIIAVRDNGIGFDPQQAERIFGVFRRLHRHGEYPGTGIGLAICKRIVEHHGGTIHATSTPGAGSTFEFTLPVINA